MNTGAIIAFSFIGLLLILISIEGNLGSVLGSIIDPANMTGGA